MNSVCVMGLGYIGLPTGALLATHGDRVLGVDTNPHVIDAINKGDIFIEEPGLHALVRAAVQSGMLRAAAIPEPSDVFIIAVPTPVAKDKSADMSCVVNATKSLLPALKRGNLVILESTSPPGACETIIKPILEQGGFRVGEDVGLAHCPERVLPGRILVELISNDRIVGGIDRRSAERARDFYARFVEGEIFVTDTGTAEMVKIIENTFRDVNIALANEAALLCEDLGINFWDVARLANRHPRVNVHNAGPGVGGHCIAVDPWFLVGAFPNRTALIHTARDRNDAMTDHVVARITELLGDMAQPKVAALGLAYKANVDDIRESPAVNIVEKLLHAGIHVACHDPHVGKAPFPLCSQEDCFLDADLIVLLTDHAAFSNIIPERVRKAVRTPLMYDTRNAFDHALWQQAGFSVSLLGCGERWS